MKKILFKLIAAITLLSPIQAGEKAPLVTLPIPAELGLTAKAFGASLIEDTDTYVFGGGLSLEVPVLFNNLSLEATGSVFEDELYTVGANILWYTPITDNFSVYTLGGGSYEFETDQWTLLTGAGVKYSLNQQFSLFADGAYNWTVENDAEDGVVLVRAGIGFSF